jgi:hypothetical protein
MWYTPRAAAGVIKLFRAAVSQIGDNHATAREDRHAGGQSELARAGPSSSSRPSMLAHRVEGVHDGVVSIKHVQSTGRIEGHFDQTSEHLPRLAIGAPDSVERLDGSDQRAVRRGQRQDPLPECRVREEQKRPYQRQLSCHVTLALVLVHKRRSRETHDHLRILPGGRDPAQ